MNSKEFEIGEKQNENISLGNKTSYDNMNATSPSYIPEQFFQYIQNPLRLFSIGIDTIKWFFTMRWYVILLIFILVPYFFIQIQSGIETRRKLRESKDDKMVETMRGIIRKSDEKHIIENAKKRVTFYTTESRKDLSYIFAGTSDLIKNSISVTQSNIIETMTRIYNWWILPWIYVIFRTIGFRP